MQVLIVDDNEFALMVLQTTLTRLGYQPVTARDGAEAMQILRNGDIRLVITDWDMPGINGIDFCRNVRHEDLSGYVYIIMLTAREGTKQRLEGLCAGADDFLNKPLDPEELLVCIKTSERILSLETRDVALFALAKLAESRDTETGAHIERVQAYAKLLAQNLSPELKAHYGVDGEFVRLIYQTSPLHDIGKVGIPDSVLLKPGKLTPEEFAIMKTHTLIGAQTLEAALRRFPSARFLQMARDIALTHHEYFDGRGYPEGLMGQQIPLCGRIVAVADVYDALTSARIYKSAMRHDQAKAIIVHDRGTHFDPDVVDAFLHAEPEIIKVHNLLQESKEPISSRGALVLPPQPDAQPVPDPRRILIVEDDDYLRGKLVELLSSTGEPVMSASNGKEALKICEEHNPRLIVTDWVMPNTDGMELCRAIRARLDADPVHLIMLTVNSEVSHLLEAYEAGVDDFIAKPFDTQELLVRVRAGLRSVKTHDELIRKAIGSRALNAQLATVNNHLERLSLTDELTGLFNRRCAMLRIEEQWTIAEHTGQPLAVAILDADHFKQVNDAYGHDAGDYILRRLAGIVRDQTRGTDIICRVGGEEFLIIFPSQTVEEAGICAERCRHAVENDVFSIGHARARTTISVGIAGRTRQMSQFPDLLKAADRALLSAKRMGRNRIFISSLNEGDSIMSSSEPVHGGKVLPDQSPAPIDVAAVLKRCGGDVKFAAAVTERFRSQASQEVQRVVNALAERDSDSLRRSAHTVKSMAAYMGAQSAVALAKQIEDLARVQQLDDVEKLVDMLREQVDQTTTWITQSMNTAALKPA